MLYQTYVKHNVIALHTYGPVIQLICATALLFDLLSKAKNSFQTQQLKL